MNTKSIFKSLATAVALLFVSQASFAGTGTNADPYTVCASSGYKLTAATTGAASYRWKDNSGAVITSSTTADLSITAQTGITSITNVHYTVEALSSAGCYSDPQDIYVSLIPAATLTAPTLAAICAANTGATASSITLNAPTSTVPTLPTGVTIAWGQWSDGTNTISTTNGAATATAPTAAGTYNYSIVAHYDGMNVGGAACTSTATASIIINALPAAPTTTIAGL